MTENDIHRITQRLLYTQPSQDSDVAILLGNAMCSGDIARAAADRFHEGRFSKIILCGGVPQKTRTLLHRRVNNIFRRHAVHGGVKLSIPLSDIFASATEAHHMRDILRQSDVPDSAIAHIDNESRNTGENFSFIRNHVLSSGYKTASVVCAVFHQRRALETCKKWLPDLDAMTVPVYPYKIAPDIWREKWAQIPFARAAMQGEDYRTNESNPDNYYKKGFCVPVKIA